MHKNQDGSSALMLLLVVVVISAIGFVGWNVYSRSQTNHQTSSTTPTQKATIPNGSTTAVDTLSTQEAADSDSTNKKADQDNESSVKEGNSTVNNMDGAFRDGDF